MSKVDCKGKGEKDCSKIDGSEECENFFELDGDTRYICKESDSGENCEKGSECKNERSNSGNTSVASLEEYETMRIIITYLVVFFICSVSSKSLRSDIYPNFVKKLFKVNVAPIISEFEWCKSLS